MKDTKKILRSAIYTALNGNVTYNAVNVPVYDEKTRIANTANLFILLENQQETDESTSETFITKSSIDFEIIQKTGTEVSKDPVDTVYETVMEILIPSTSTIGLTVPAAFQFQNATRESAFTQSVALSETETIVTCKVKLVFTIVQK